MAFDTSCLFYSSLRRRSGSFRTFFFVPATLALLTCLFILLYLSTTSNLFSHTHPNTLPPKPLSGSSLIFGPTHKLFLFPPENASTTPPEADWRFDESRRSTGVPLSSIGDYINNNQVYHDKYIFLEDYKEMNRSFKIYVYPHRRDVSFANALLPVDFEPGGNYASESYFKKVLLKSQFMTNDPNKADLFFLPFSIARLRHDPRVGVGGIQDFIRDYNLNISQMYPYWNRTGGADHFYVACHSIGRKAMEKASEVKHNAIQVVCSSSYFLPGYIPHKDACLPQIWPREGEPPDLVSSKRTQLAFFAGEINSPVRQKLLEVWRNDTEIFAHYGRLKTPYADELLRSKFCLHVKGFEVNTARIGDSLYYGCVPVIIANYYDLPFADIINWRSFSVVVTTLDIPLLKKVLKEISPDEYLRLKSNVLKVRKHFKWHPSPIDYDAFYMVMYELWLRRSILRIS